MLKTKKFNFAILLLALFAFSCEKNEVNESTSSEEGTKLLTAPNKASIPSINDPNEWNVLLEDNFSGTVLDETKWYVYEGLGHHKIGRRERSAISVANGMMTITASRVNNIPTSGLVISRKKFMYGKVEFWIRAQNDLTGKSAAVALTFPEDNVWPQHGENDIYETDPTVNPRNHFKTNIHFYDPNACNNNNQWCDNRVAAAHFYNPTQWQRLTMEWEKRFIRIFVNNQLKWVLTNQYVIPDYSHGLHFQLDLQASDFNNTVTMDVDWAKISQRKRYNLIAGEEMYSLEGTTFWKLSPQYNNNAVRNSSVTFSNDVLNYSNPVAYSPFENNVIYQPVEVVAGKKYKVSAGIITSGGVINSWLEFFIGATKPVDGANYNDNRFLALDNWNGSGCLTTGLNGDIATLACAGSGVATQGVYTATTTGTVYFVMKVGSMNGRIESLKIDNVKMMEQP